MKRMLLKFSALSLAVILACSTWAAAQTQSKNPTPARASTDEPALGSISGSVVNESGQPLAGVLVSVREINAPMPTRSSITDSEGNFRVDGLGPSLYFVSASLPAYVSEELDFNSPASHHRIGDSVRVELVRGGVITGMVTNAAGEPLINVRVRAVMVRDPKGQIAELRFFAFAERTTDDRGIYRIFGLAPGTYLISAGGGGSAQQFVFNPYDSDVPTYAPSSTRDTAAEVNVRAGEETNVDIRYRGESGHAISGSIKVEGPYGASAMLLPVGSSLPLAATFQMPGGRGFAFYGVADGEYDLVAQAAKGGASSPAPLLSVSDPRRVIVKGADITGVELVTKPLASIAGRIALQPATVTECQGKRRPLFAEMLVGVQRPEKEKENDALRYLRLLPLWVRRTRRVTLCCETSRQAGTYLSRISMGDTGISIQLQSLLRRRRMQ